MTLKNEENRKFQKNTQRRTYHAPSFVVYGDLKELTASGSGGAAEAGSSSKNKRS